MAKYTFLKTSEVVTPSDTSETALTTVERGSGNYGIFVISSLSLDGSTDWVVKCEISYDKSTWIKLRYPDDSAEWSRTYSGDISNPRIVAIYDASNNSYIPIPAPYFRLTVTLTTFSGSPTLTLQQGVIE